MQQDGSERVAALVDRDALQEGGRAATVLSIEGVDQVLNHHGLLRLAGDQRPVLDELLDSRTADAPPLSLAAVLSHPHRPAGSTRSGTSRSLDASIHRQDSELGYYMIFAERPPLHSRVSALVTTYNHSPYIGEAIESLLQQSHPLLEIIVVDDGSTDDTFERARRFERHGVTVVRTANGGASHAMNIAMQAASGNIFVLQSGDDVSLPHRVAVQLDALARTECAITTAPPFLIDETGRPLPDDVVTSFFKSRHLSTPELFLKALFFELNFVSAPSVTLTRSVHDRIGSFNEGLLQLQDYDYWLRATSAGINIAMEEERVVLYRRHSDNLSVSANETRTIRELRWIMRALAKTLSSKTLSTILYGGDLSELAEGIPRKALLPLLYLRHPHPDIRQIGFEHLITLAEDQEACQEAFEHLGLSRPTIFKLLLQAA